MADLMRNMPDVLPYREKFQRWADAKKDEIEEHRTARRYYHGNQWTADEVKVLRERKQPIITANRIQRKVDGIVGLHVRNRQGPKAHGRTPVHEREADVATAVLKYAGDESDWQSVRAECMADLCIGGICVTETNLTPDANMGDMAVTIARVEPEKFFYDPRSVRHDFSDARYMGVWAWVDMETAISMFPDMDSVIRASVDQSFGSSGDLSQADWKFLWVDSKAKLIRLCEMWSRSRNGWRYCHYTGSAVLAEGESPYLDGEGKSGCRFEAQSGYVDESGDRYGIVRGMISQQDEINHRRSKLLHMISVRQTWAKSGAVKSVNDMRRELARADGHVEIEGEWGADAGLIDQNAQTSGQAELLREAKDEIENFGPNQALIGQEGVSDSSGRAIALLQQAGMAELALFLARARAMALRVYRKTWQNIRRHWKAERYIRVTDADDVAQFIPINRLEIDGMGIPSIQNGLGAIDVDIVIDESADPVTLRSETFTKMVDLTRAGIPFPPEVLIEMSDLDADTRRRVLERMQKAGADPARRDAMVLDLANKKAGVDLKQAQAAKTQAGAIREMAGAALPAFQ